MNILTLSEIGKNIDNFLKEYIFKYYNSPVFWVIIFFSGILLFGILYRNSHKENH